MLKKLKISEPKTSWYWKWVTILSCGIQRLAMVASELSLVNTLARSWKVRIKGIGLIIEVAVKNTPEIHKQVEGLERQLKNLSPK